MTFYSKTWYPDGTQNLIFEKFNVSAFQRRVNRPHSLRRSKTAAQVKMYNFSKISCVFENFNFWGQNCQKLTIRWFLLDKTIFSWVRPFFAHIFGKENLTVLFLVRKSLLLERSKQILHKLCNMETGAYFGLW